MLIRAAQAIHSPGPLPAGDGSDPGRGNNDAEDQRSMGPHNQTLRYGWKSVVGRPQSNNLRTTKLAGDMQGIFAAGRLAEPKVGEILAYGEIISGFDARKLLTASAVPVPAERRLICYEDQCI